jgi:hypothetical protein
LATFCVRLEAQSGTMGVVVELVVVFELLLLFDFDPPIFKLI